jgi:hypothetical protein
MKQSLSRSMIALALAASFATGYAQDTKTDYNRYYRYPLSLGAQYQSLTALGSYRSSYDLYDISALIRYPLPKLPSLQPSLQGGLIQFSPREDDTKWEHKDVYGLLGASYTKRFSKSFELGGELSAGASLSIYPNLVPDSGNVDNVNFLARGGARLALIPSFNFSVELCPSLSWIHSLGALTDFDGAVLGIGLAAHIRLGDDPDAPQAALRSLRFGQIGPVSVFPAMQSWYAKNPIAKLTVTNTESFPVKDLELTFFQKGYMDSPTSCARIDSLAPGESKEVGILASFNEEVFRNEGTTPLSGEIVASYTGRGRAAEQRTSLSYDLLDKSAIVWDDDRKAAAFVTPADSALRNFASYVRQINKDSVAPGYSETVQFACQIFNALGELGIIYQVDPTQPFESVKGGKSSIDSVSLPRQTLKRITGDCDDLSVLYASLLESAGVSTALITIPGHIYIAFDTKTVGKSFGEIHPDRGMTINLNDELWVPVEITMIGLSGFNDAWRKGIEEWKSCDADPAARGFYLTAKAQELYRPVGLKETDLGLQYGKKEPVVAKSSAEVAKLIDGILEVYQAAAKASNGKEDYNKLGVRLARYGRYDKAVVALKQASALDPNFAGPKMNLGNVYYLTKSYDKALSEYQKLDTNLSAASGNGQGLVATLRLNISRCYDAMGKGEDSAKYYGLAVKLDPTISQKYSYLGQSALAATTAAAAGGVERAAKAEVNDIIFAE